ncbi:putative copper resistance protein, CopC family [Longispora fulva]|uniref:Methionine-rich copper-binding protein CopC n=1 Tax=Longispora fulva TaxID=619741 RepID=A0A8J7GR73_9ACTN|nr:copper resistance CopC family protein [Longispora fulva]MBG6135466.1 methionine-rich copper-binding protein CopC [Longispora fulva]GIG56292.1 putative copper resistance protein, CopC family [Longispora fulva]
MTNLGTVRRLVLTLTAGLVAAVAVATPASAHARLLSTTPTDGTTVPATVTAVTLTFTDPLKEQFTTVVVTGSGGGAHADGAPKVSGTTVTQQVTGLPAGQVRVAWRTVSQDGHPVEGAFTFTVGASDGAVPAGPAAAGTPTTGVSNPDVAVTATPPGRPRRWPWLLAGGVVLLAAAAGTLLWSSPRRRT